MPFPRFPYSQLLDGTTARVACILGMVMMITACGYKGPLYMPPPPAPQESLTTPPSQMETARPPKSDAASPPKSP